MEIIGTLILTTALAGVAGTGLGGLWTAFAVFPEDDSFK